MTLPGCYANVTPKYLQTRFLGPCCSFRCLLLTRPRPGFLFVVAAVFSCCASPKRCWLVAVGLSWTSECIVSVPEPFGRSRRFSTTAGFVLMSDRGANRFHVLVGWDGIPVQPIHRGIRFRLEAHDSTMAGRILQNTTSFSGKGLRHVSWNRETMFGTVRAFVLQPCQH